MQSDEAIKLLLEGRSTEWNQYRKSHPDWTPDLRAVDLSQTWLVPLGKAPFDLSRADLRGAKLPENSLYFSELALGTAGEPERVMLRGALIDAETTYASSFDPVEAGAIFVSRSEQSKMNASSPPRVFVSYAWANDDVVLAIDAWLRRKGLVTKIDRRDFFAGSRIRDEILRVMGDCDVILIFYSAESRTKPWPQFEREIAADLEMTASQEGRTPPRILFVVMDDTPLPGVIEKNRIAIVAGGKRFPLVCEEIYHSILMLPKATEDIDPDKWDDYVF